MKPSPARPFGRPLDRLRDALPLSAADRCEAALAALSAREDPAAIRRVFGPAAADEALWADHLFRPQLRSRPQPAFRRGLEAQLLAAHAAQRAGAATGLRAQPTSPALPAPPSQSLGTQRGALLRSFSFLASRTFSFLASRTLSRLAPRPSPRPLLLGIGSLCLAAFLLAQPAPLPSGLSQAPTAMTGTLPAAAGPTGTDTPRARATATSHQVGRVLGTATAGG